MLAIIDHLQAINRSMLNRLRPMALGHVPLGDLLVRTGARARQRAASADRASRSPAACSSAAMANRSISRSIAACRKASPTRSATRRRRRSTSRSARPHARRTRRPRPQLELHGARRRPRHRSAGAQGTAPAACRSACRRSAASYTRRQRARPRHAACASRSRCGTPVMRPARRRRSAGQHEQRADHRRSSDRAAGLPAHACGRRRG